MRLLSHGLLGSPRHLGVTGAPPHPEFPAYEAIRSAGDRIASCTPHGSPRGAADGSARPGRPPPLDLDDGGAGDGPVKVARSLPLAALGDSPRRPARCSAQVQKGERAAVCRPSHQPTTRDWSPHHPGPLAPLHAELAPARDPRNSSSHPQMTRGPAYCPCCRDAATGMRSSGSPRGMAQRLVRGELGGERGRAHSVLWVCAFRTRVEGARSWMPAQQR